tara:strand:- start:110606 stop:110737 length:132 start_codon:yes stop_codon:yes gene_type:complete
MFRLIRLVILAAIAIAVATWISESRGDNPAPRTVTLQFAGENS